MRFPLTLSGSPKPFSHTTLDSTSFDFLSVCSPAYLPPVLNFGKFLKSKELPLDYVCIFFKVSELHMQLPALGSLKTFKDHCFKYVFKVSRIRVFLGVLVTPKPIWYILFYHHPLIIKFCNPATT
jgi:hypothetical protein